MYTLVSATLKEKGVNNIWKEVSIGSMTLPTIFSTYVSGHIKLNNSWLDDPVYVDLNDLRAAPLPITNQTFVAWLSYIGERSLPSTQVEPIYNKTQVTYTDVFRAGYNVKRVHPLAGDSDNFTISELTDLYLHKDGIDINLLQSRALVTVNGYLHLAVPYKDGLKISDAVKTINKTGKNLIGLISFEKVGDVELLRITDDIIGKADDRFAYSQGVYLSLGINLNNKSILLSVGGFLNVGDDAIKIINPEMGIVKINVSRLNILKRVISSYMDLDMSSLELTTAPGMSGSININELLSDEKIIKYLQHANSFIVIVDTPSLYYDYIPMDNVPLYGLYEYHTKPTLPMIDSLGRLPEYISVAQADRYVVKTMESYSVSYNYETAPISSLDFVNNIAQVGGKSKEIGHFLDLGSVTRA